MIGLSGADLVSMKVFGKLQLYPKISLAENMRAGFEIVTIFPDNFAKGLTQLSGVMMTLLVSTIAAATFRKTVYHLIGILYCLDLWSYLLLPPLGIRRWLLFGSSYSELLQGAFLLGISPIVFIVSGLIPIFILFTKIGKKEGKITNRSKV